MAAMASSLFLAVLFFLCLRCAYASGRLQLGRPKIFMPTEAEGGSGGDEKKGENAAAKGTTWALLVAGSKGFGNYRHQADVCHAYQILKKGGIKDANIVVFMYDDIANNPVNPRPGIIINHPRGSDVYAGVPKDYTGEHVTVTNLFAALLGNKKGVKGGSGKVIDSKPEDRIFIYYSDHGGPGFVGMPNGEILYANDLIGVLRKKHNMGTYKEMVIYVESCESGSMFEGLLPDNLNIYVMTASNAREDSWAAYCPGMSPPPPAEFSTCLGDLYSVSWMEDSEKHNLKKETVAKQYAAVKERTLNHNAFMPGSHVMEYGTMGIKKEKLYHYQGFDPANSNVIDDNITKLEEAEGFINQRDADLYFLMQRYEHVDEASEEKVLLLEEMAKTTQQRVHIHSSVELIGKFLFGAQDGPSVLKAVRPSGRALVDDWTCLKSMVEVFEVHCGRLTRYGTRHTRAFANICNKGVSRGAMKRACISVCGIRTRVSP